MAEMAGRAKKQHLEAKAKDDKGRPKKGNTRQFGPAGTPMVIQTDVAVQEMSALASSSSSSSSSATTERPTSQGPTGRRPVTRSMSPAARAAAQYSQERRNRLAGQPPRQIQRATAHGARQRSDSSTSQQGR